LWSKIGARKNALWALDYDGGVEKSFCCLHSNARDFSKLGLLMLGRGEVFGRRVVSGKYVDWVQSVPALVDGDSNFGGLVDYYSNGWWVAEVDQFSVIYARGFNGQYVVVVPGLNLVFVRLGFFDDERSTQNNNYKLSDNLLFLIKQVIKEYSF